MSTIEILNLSHEGRGVGRDNNGKTVFVDGTLPGELVQYTVTKRKSTFDEARAVEILRPAKQRAIPKCNSYAICGGCAQQHIEPLMQITAKQTAVLELLQHTAGVQPQQLMPAIVGPNYGYRSKARLGVRYVTKKGKVLVGFREKQSNYLADIEECMILHPVIGSKISDFKNFIGSLGCKSSIAQLEIAVGGERLAVIVRHLEGLSEIDQARWIEFAQQQDFNLYLQPGGMDTVHKVWPLDGVDRLYYELPDFGLRFAFHPTDFTQVNEQINRQMVAQALQWLQVDSRDVVLDLFCGLGNFSLPLAKRVLEVVAVEGSVAMVERGYENARLNGIENVQFYAADLTKDQGQQVWAKFDGNKYNKILLDPPRAGALEIMPLLKQLGADMLLYVSCNPATLARDTKVLVEECGYTLDKLGVMDMFPHTTHVETMALFRR